MVPRSRVLPDARLVHDLGAESLDFLDLVFRLEASLGRAIPIDRWRGFVVQEAAGKDPAEILTTAFVLRFARAEYDRP